MGKATTLASHMPHETVAFEVNKLLGRLLPLPQQALVSTSTVSSFRPVRWGTAGLAPDNDKERQVTKPWSVDANRARSLEQMPDDENGLSLAASLPYEARTRKEGQSARNRHQPHNLFLLWSAAQSDPRMSAAMSGDNRHMPLAQVMRANDNTINPLAALSDGENVPLLGLARPRANEVEGQLDERQLNEVERFSSAPNSNERPAQSASSLSAQPMFSKPTDGRGGTMGPAMGVTSPSIAARHGWRVVPMGKRGPKCMRECIAQGLLHPLQCHSLC